MATAEALGEVGQPQAHRHAVEAEALLDAERVPPRERQADAAEDDAGDRRTSRRRATSGPPGSVSVARDDRREAAADGHREQQRGIDDGVQHRQPLLGDRVVGGLVVRRDADARGERSGHPARDARGRARSGARQATGARRPRAPARARKTSGKGVTDRGGKDEGDAPSAGMRKWTIPFYATPMPQDANHLIWIDMEMTGLVARARPDHRGRARRHRRESRHGRRGARLGGPPGRRVLAGMDSWNRPRTARAASSPRSRPPLLDEATVEAQALAFLAEHVPPRRRRCAATRSARTGASSRAGCRASRTGSTIATSTSRR